MMVCGKCADNNEMDKLQSALAAANERVGVLEAELAVKKEALEKIAGISTMSGRRASHARNEMIDIAKQALESEEDNDNG
jgi:hypothetical protein